MLRNIVKPVSDAPEGEFEPSRRSRPTLMVVPSAPETPVQPSRRGEATLDLRTDGVVVELFDQDTGDLTPLPKRGSARGGPAARNGSDPQVLLVEPAKSRVERIIEAEDDPSSILVTQPIVQIFESATPTRRRMSRSVEVLLVGLVLGVGATLFGATLSLGNNAASSGRTLIETSIGEAVVVERASIDADSTVLVQSGADEPVLAPNGAPAADEAVVLSSGSVVADPPGGAVGDGAQVTSAP